MEPASQVLTFHDGILHYEFSGIFTDSISCRPHEILVLFQPRVLYELFEISYPYLLPMLQSWMRVRRSAPNDPRGSKWINMGIWGWETFVPGDHSISTVFEGWMNSFRQGMYTDKKDVGKRSSSVTSEKMVHRHVNCWSIILTDQLYYKLVFFI